MKIGNMIGIVIAAGWLMPAFHSLSQAATVDELFASINKLAPQERQRRLEEGAKKEGNLVVYSNQGLETIQEYSHAFQKKYPFVKVEASRLQGAKGLDRILLEYRVGKLPADVVG
ncbi:MAG: hypothetical protein ACREQV_07510, partial [Candidatus Binatia bacterium]